MFEPSPPPDTHPTRHRLDRHPLADSMTRQLSAFHIFEGLRDGLSHFSGPSRAAILYAIRPDDPMRIYDPQNLLRGHEPKLRELYIDTDRWRPSGADLRHLQGAGHPFPEKNLGLAGLISFGGRSRSVAYQMWFTEHHPDMCSTGPTERWLEHAVWLLSHDMVAENTSYLGASGYVLQEYTTHAVRDHLVDELNRILGMDLHMRIYPILDAVLGISKTLEEGVWPRGRMAFVQPESMNETPFLARFPDDERPNLTNFKHVRKLLQAVENSDDLLASDGRALMGIARNPLPPGHIIADFRSGHGFIFLGDDPVCSFFDGRYHSTTRRAKLVELEELLLESHLTPATQHALFRTVLKIVHNAEDRKHGCTLVIDLNDPVIEISGQRFETPLDLSRTDRLMLTQSLSALDGALHIGADLRLHGFACLLDGRSIRGEDRARGARFNSALRFTADHRRILVIVVSADRPVSLIQEGVELNAQCPLKPVSACVPSPPTLAGWIGG
jgi:hypothetical protein